MANRMVAVLDSMWDWRQMTSGAGYAEAPRSFRINPDNFSGKRLYRICGPDATLLVTNACRELCSSANHHGTPDPAWLHENLKLLEPFDVLLICGRVARATYARCGYVASARVFEMMHPAARTWTNAMLNATAAEVQAAAAARPGAGDVT
jgi:hypothetical protein